MGEENEIATALIEAFKIQDIKDILKGYCKNMTETKHKLKTEITEEVKKIKKTTANYEARLMPRSHCRKFSWHPTRA